ncbi:hypothetical protein JCM10908_006555 [Rhodotorula pacifica]|uniref:APC family permease n=1 Tax=Rhodotorula pacifica TaxID=1495444 RepID=UPI00316F43FD
MWSAPPQTAVITSTSNTERDVAELPAMTSAAGPSTSTTIRQRRGRRTSAAGGTAPSYAESEWIEIIRRQRARPGAGTLKLPQNNSSSAAPSPVLGSADPDRGQTYPPLASKGPPQLANEWEFSGWGSVSFVELNAADIDAAVQQREEEKKRDGHETLGAWLASGVAGVAVAGSPLYAFPSLVAVAGVYSPISLLIATILLAFWRPIMADLAAALPISGANYAYLLNASSSVPFALIGASLTLLDDISTSVVAAATASVYIADQSRGVVSTDWMTIVLLVVIAAVGLIGIRGSAGVTLTTLAFHLLTLAVLILCSVVHWGRHGNETLKANWEAGQLGSAREVVKAIYLGICIAFLGVTGFETTPDYASALRPSPHIYPAVLRSLQYIAIAINAPLLLCAFAVLPLDRILSVSSVLSDLGRTSAGKWLEIWVTVDAVVILLATILSGLVAALELLQRLSLDGFLPRWFLKPLPFTGVPALVVVLFTSLSILVYVTSAMSLSVVSSLFALVFLSIMLLYPISLLLLLYNRPTLLGSTRRSSFLLIVGTLMLDLVLIGGVIANDPLAIAYLAGYGSVLTLLAWTAAWWGRGLRWVWWVAEHGLNWHKGARWCVRMIRRAKVGNDVVILVKGDEINKLFRRILYVEANEATSHITLVHFYGDGTSASRAGMSPAEMDNKAAFDARTDPPVLLDHEERIQQQSRSTVAVERPEGLDAIPSELEANAMILDEAFPSITVDLVLVRAPFTPSCVHALGHHLGVANGRMMMGAPSEGNHGEREFGVRDLAGVRVISE